MKKIWRAVLNVLNIGGKVAEKLPNPIVNTVGTVIDELIPDHENKKRVKKSKTKK